MSQTTTYEATARKLISASEKKKYDPFNRVEYQARLNGDRWQFPERFLSLYDLPIYEDLSDEQKWRLSLLEAVNFFSVNIHGEQALVAAMEPRLYRNKRVGEDPVSSQYMQRFIHEENSHTYMLAEYCLRYHGSVLPDRAFAVAQPKLSPETEDLLFWGRVYVLESYLGFVNQNAKNDGDLDSTPRQVHEFHLIDEARHKAWDKVMIEENLNRARKKRLDSEIETVKGLMSSYQEYIYQSSCNPTVYRLLGLENGLGLRADAIDNENRKALLRPWYDGLEKYFAKIGF
jgi:hypothetical protein